jgi:hypothetical protein
MAKKALRLALWPAVISLLVTVARFIAELAGVPGPITFLIGITWVAVLVGLYYGVKLAGEARPYALLALTMLFLGFLSRIPVVGLWWLTKTHGLGTHYDVYGSWSSVLLFQLVAGPLTHVVFGLPGMALLAWKRRKRAVPA